MSRIRRIFDKAQIAHIWAQGPNAIAEHGADIQTSTGNLFTRSVWVSAGKDRAGFDESAIWSYGSHYCLARFARVRTGGHVVLFNRNGYSKTTQRQRHIVRHALRGHGFEILECDKPQASGPRDHAENLADYRREYEAAVISAGRSRIREATRAAELARAERILSDANRYAVAFGLGRQRLRPMNTATIAARVKREERAAEKQRQAAAEQRARDLAALRVKFDAKLDQWRAGILETHLLPAAREFPVAMRVKPGGHGPQSVPGLGEFDAGPLTIETTHGAEFPAEAARGLWVLIKRARLSGQAYAPSDSRAVAIGSFHLDSIAADGTVTAGCHTVPFAECERLAAILGLES